MANRPPIVPVIVLASFTVAMAGVPVLLWLLAGNLLAPLGGSTLPLNQCQKFDPSRVSATVRIVLPLDGNAIGATRNVLQRDYKGDSDEIAADALLLDDLKNGKTLSNYGTPNLPPSGATTAPFHVFLDGLSPSQSKHEWAQIRVIATDTSRYTFTTVLDGVALNGVGFSSGKTRFICTPSGIMPAPLTIAGPTTNQLGEVAVFYGAIGNTANGNKKENGFNIVYEAPYSDTPVIVDPKIKNNG